MTIDKIVITTEDLAKVDTPSPPAPPTTHPVPLQWRLASVLLILLPPLLFLACVFSLYITRDREISVRHTYSLLWCRLLLACGLLWSIAIGVTAWLLPEDPQPVSIEERRTSLTVETFPQLPSDATLTGKEIAAEMTRMVVAISGIWDADIESSGDLAGLPLGAGVIVFADTDGALVLTCRHVLDNDSQPSELEQGVHLMSHDDQLAMARIVGIHRSLDLALLWVGRNNGKNVFIQLLGSYDSVEVGEQVYAIGHPEGLAFSISSGLVAQKRDGNHLQISAPISLGNSGGPVYDSHGRLVGIVESVWDKSMEPNAENLNFAVSLDDLLIGDAWNLSKQGKMAIEAIGGTPEGSEEVIDTPTTPDKYETDDSTKK